MVASAQPNGPQNDLGRRLANAARALQESPGPEVMGQCLKIGMKNVADNFDRSTAASGVPWAERKYIGDGHPLLIDTGRLISGALGEDVGMSALAAGSGGAIGEHSRTITGQEAVAESQTPYGIFHMTGTARMPARPFYEIDDDACDAMQDLVADACQQRVADALE